MSGGEPYVIRPFAGPIDATVVVPGSKSFTNRALVAAALARGTSILRGVLDSDDTQAMIGCLRAIGIAVTHDPIAATVEVVGCGGVIGVDTGSVNVRQSGTTARFITPMLSLGSGAFEIDGHEQMRKRPMNELTEALRSFGVRIEGVSGEDRLPFRLQAQGVSGGTVSIPGNLSSQFLSGLLLSAPCYTEGLDVRIVGDLVSKPYVDMTISTMEAFGAKVEREGYERFVVAPTGYQSCDYQIEPDASAASYFFAAAAITGGRVRIEGLGTKAVQGDVAFVDALQQMGATVTKTEDAIEVRGPQTLRGITINMEDYSDTAQTLAAVAAHADSPTTVTGVGFIRHKETDRVSAVVTELNRAGIQATNDPDGFTIVPGKPQPTSIHTYDDHRMAMSFSLLGLRTAGISIENPGCVAKTFPTYFTVFESVRPNADADLRVVAIDGVLGAGKTTVARKLAKSLSLEYLDTGAMYRSIGLACLRAGLNMELRGTPEFDADAATMALRAQIEVGLDQSNAQFVVLDGDDVTTEIREPHVAMAASAVATVAGVRTALVEQQRAWARRRGGGVLEGRDIATAVFPSAPVKIFLTADVMERAKRRHAEQPGRTIEEVVADLEARDHQDSTRAVDPLRIADGATVVDTTGLSIDEVVQRCVDIARPLLSEKAEIANAVSKATLVKQTQLRDDAPSQASTRHNSTEHDSTGASKTMSVTSTDTSTGPVEEPVVGGNALKSRIAFRVLRTFGMFVSRVFFRATYEGMEHLPPTGAYLIAPSHRSNLDSFVIPGITKRKIRYLGKDSIWKFKPLGWLLTTGGAISVVRGTPDREAMRMCVRALQAGDPIVVYPEGRRKSGPVVEDLFDGVAFMATKAGVPIVPVGIGGSEAAMGAHHKIPRPKHIHVVVGPPIYPTTDGTGKAGRSEIRSITATLQTEIQRLFDEAQRKA